MARSRRASTRSRSPSTPSRSARCPSRSRTPSPRRGQAHRRSPTTRRTTTPPEIVEARQKFVEEYTGVKLAAHRQVLVRPAVTAGNIENFTGVAQVPIGFAGPLKVNGEHAQGEFLIPLATTEGTLVASYNRGMKVLNLSRRRDRARWSTTACSARRCSSSTTRARGARLRALGRRPTSTRSARQAEATSSVGQAALHRHLPGQQVRLPALQLLHRRRRRPEHGRPRHLRRLLAGSSSS